MRKPAIMNKVRKNFGSHGKLNLYSYKNTFLIGIAVVVVVALIASIFVKVKNKKNDKNSVVNPVAKERQQVLFNDLSDNNLPQ